MIALLLTAAAVFGLVTVADATGADSVGFVITATLLGFGLAPFVGNSLEPLIADCQWDRMSLSRAASRQWGVDLFNVVLWKIGWNKLVLAMRDREAGQGKDWALRPMRAAAAGHAWAFLLHATTAVWAGVSGGHVPPVVLVVIGIIGHLYPFLLQIRLLTRLRTVKSRQGRSDVI